MSLALYKKKRKFTSTAEPEGGKATGSGLRFVVQKHDASHLHYDFRLEMEGVLKSWAVPKGPSLNPENKRLAMMVEDHPFDYRNFEGIIPEGNYGAGTVIVWDEGTYEPVGAEGERKKQQEKLLLDALKKKKIKITLHGKKLKGEFALFKTGYGADNAWLLTKLDDKYASTADITEKDKSVISKRNLEQVAKANGTKVKRRMPGTRAKARAPKSGIKKKIALKKKKTAAEPSLYDDDAADPAALLKTAHKAPFPQPFKPMLATRVAEPFNSAEWVYEIKWDGYRTVAYLNGSKGNIYSRNLLSFNDKFQPVLKALLQLNVKAVIDGEVVALDEEGKPSFQLLQNHAGENIRFAFYAFDLVWYNGYDVSGLELLNRKALLAAIIPKADPVIKFSSQISEKGIPFFETAVEHGLEGVMAKKAAAAYAINTRSREWLKIKNDKRLEAIICGFTKPRNSRSYFGAVILGRYKGEQLEYIGHSGSGFDEAALKKLNGIFNKLVTSKCPFSKVPKTNMPVTWLRPELVCEVKFTEWTSDGILRHPIFLGLREDKKAVTEKNEKVVKAPVKAGRPKAPSKKPAAEKTPVTKSGDGFIKVGAQTLRITHPDKIYWPKEKITKGDLIAYYDEICPYILPYMKNRPQSLNRNPDGIDKPGFYQKNMAETAPDWITTLAYKSESKKTNYLVCKSKADLLYMASLGCIEMNPWHSRVGKVDYPDWCVIDLDPDTNTFNKVIETAKMVKQVLNSIAVDGYCKTSGSTGIHIYIPLGARYTYDQSRMLAELIVQLVHRELPTFTSLERSPAKREGKIYLDYLQNKSTQTIAAPYSLRPRPGAPVSTPLNWDELVKGLKITDFNIHTIFDRLKETGDLFKPVLGKGISLEKAVARMETLQ